VLRTRSCKNRKNDHIAAFVFSVRAVRDECSEATSLWGWCKGKICQAQTLGACTRPSEHRNKVQFGTRQIKKVEYDHKSELVSEEMKVMQSALKQGMIVYNEVGSDVVRVIWSVEDKEVQGDERAKPWRLLRVFNGLHIHRCIELSSNIMYNS
jgi:hypothetical protein